MVIERSEKINNKPYLHLAVTPFEELFRFRPDRNLDRDIEGNSVGEPGMCYEEEEDDDDDDNDGDVEA